MKGNIKIVICHFLATIIVVTTVGYAPPFFALVQALWINVSK